MKATNTISKSKNSKLKERISHLEKVVIKKRKESKKYIHRDSELLIIEKNYPGIGKHLQRIFEESAIGMGLTNFEGKFTQVNPSFCRMLGYSKKELVSKYITDITYTEDITAQQQYHKKLLLGKIKSYQFQKRYVHKDGHLIWVLLSTTMVKDRNGKPLYIIGQVQDITEKMRAEEDLKKSEERYRQLVELSPDMIFITVDGKITYINTAGTLLLGASDPKEIIGKRVLDFIHPDFKEVVRNRIRKSQDEFIKVPFLEEKYLRLDGSAIEVEVAAVPFTFQGKLMAQVVVRDISERKHLEKELHKWAQVIENADWGIAIGGADGKTLEAMNPAYAKMHGYTIEELIGKPISIVYPPKSVATLYDNIRIAHEKGSHIFETLHIRKDGTIFPLLANITAIKDKKGKVVFRAVNIRDISEWKRLENELLRAKDKAEDADRLKTAFLCNMSHEIRTPMNAIMGFAELIESQDLPVEKRIAYAKTINHRANDLLNIINDIIDVSKIESGTLNIIEESGFINIVLDEIKQFFKTRNENLIKKPIEFRVHNTLKGEQNKVICDFQRLKQVLINLVENALKFTTSGFIEIGCELIENNTEILIYVRDTGLGIPKNKQSLIFDRFRQVDESLYGKKQSGTGLGLSISKGLIEIMKGKLWVESQEGKGSTFYFNIPYKISKEAIETLTKNAPAVYDWTNKSILLVEDVDYNADVISEILSSTGVRVEVAINGSSAIEHFKENPNYDLILMDIRLPDISGLEVTHTIKKIRKDIIVVAQTAYASDEDKIRCFESGCQEFISKPINYTKMLKMLDKYLH